MTAVKRLPVVLEAFRGLLDGGVEATLCLVGEGPDRDEVERLARRLGITRNCLFVGYQRDVAPYYRLFDVLAALVGERGDAGGRDRGARRRPPVVSTGVGGVADVVRDGVDGLLVPPEDAPALTRALAPLARDPELRERMGARRRGRRPPATPSTG